MVNKVSDRGYWISNNDNEHMFLPELSVEINKYVLENNIKTVYDFGCGKGDYLYELCKSNSEIEATGFEGYQTNGVFDNIKQLDLSEKINLNPVDMILSIEVGEHIPKEFEQNFIDNISNHAKNHVIISWAVVGQDGLGHFNCQNNDYIISEFNKRGWTFNRELSNTIRSNMRPNIWIRNTLMFFYK